MLDKIFGLDRPANNDEEFALLITVYNQEELAVIRSLLESADIPYMYKERGSGSAVNIIMGYTFFGTDIYVPKSAVDEASELINPENCEFIDGDGETLSEEECDEDNDFDTDTEEDD